MWLQACIVLGLTRRKHGLSFFAKVYQQPCQSMDDKTLWNRETVKNLL